MHFIETISPYYKSLCAVTNPPSLWVRRHNRSCSPICVFLSDFSLAVHRRYRNCTALQPLRESELPRPLPADLLLRSTRAILITFTTQTVPPIGPENPLLVPLHCRRLDMEVVQFRLVKVRGL